LVMAVPTTSLLFPRTEGQGFLSDDRQVFNNPESVFGIRCVRADGER